VETVENYTVVVSLPGRNPLATFADPRPARRGIDAWLRIGRSAYYLRSMPDTKVRPSTMLFSTLTVALVVLGVLSVARSAYASGFISLAFALVPLGAVWILTTADGPEFF
jgi:hypothetical protein